MDDIKGIAFVPEHVGDLKGKFIFASLVVSFRHGREEDEIMGVSFKKDLVVDRVQVFPKGQDDKNNKLQAKLIQKLGEANAKPFSLSFPQSAPNSVLIRGEEGDTSQMGVSYEVRIHIADSIDDYDGSKKNTVCMNIRKSQYSSPDEKPRSPTAKADKGFFCE